MRSIPIIFIVFFVTTWSFGQCPSITVVGPEGITNPGDEMKFRVEVGRNAAGLEYFWSVDKGNIVAGQGSAEITVATPGTSNIEGVSATVKVGGLASECKNRASETAPLAPAGSDPVIVDEYGDLKPNEVRARLDTFFVEVSNNPAQVGLIILYVTPEERVDSKNQRLAFILKHARYRKFDLSRIWFRLDAAPERRTTLQRVAPDIDPFPCDRCKIIKGGDLR